MQSSRSTLIPLAAREDAGPSNSASTQHKERVAPIVAVSTDNTQHKGSGDDAPGAGADHAAGSTPPSAELAHPGTGTRRAETSTPERQAIMDKYLANGPQPGEPSPEIWRYATPLDPELEALNRESMARRSASVGLHEGRSHASSSSRAHQTPFESSSIRPLSASSGTAGRKRPDTPETETRYPKRRTSSTVAADATRAEAVSLGRPMKAGTLHRCQCGCEVRRIRVVACTVAEAKGMIIRRCGAVAGRLCNTWEWEREDALVVPSASAVSKVRAPAGGTSGKDHAKLIQRRRNASGSLSSYLQITKPIRKPILRK